MGESEVDRLGLGQARPVELGRLRGSRRGEREGDRRERGG